MAELTLTAIAREAGVRPSTLRYYERIGLLPSARRVAGRRRYDVCALKRLELIAYAKRAGFRLAQIQGPSGKRLPREAARPPLARTSRSGRSRTGRRKCQVAE